MASAVALAAVLSGGTAWLSIATRLWIAALLWISVLLVATVLWISILLVTTVLCCVAILLRISIVLIVGILVGVAILLVRTGSLALFFHNHSIAVVTISIHLRRRIRFVHRTIHFVKRAILATGVGAARPRSSAVGSIRVDGVVRLICLFSVVGSPTVVLRVRLESAVVVALPRLAVVPVHSLISVVAAAIAIRARSIVIVPCQNVGD